MKNGKITVVMTGGTICSVIKGDAIDVSNEPVVINEYRRIYGDDVEFRIVRPFNILSENSCPKVWTALGRALADIHDDSDGVIITHGTDTLWYFAAQISLL